MSAVWMRLGATFAVLLLVGCVGPTVDKAADARARAVYAAIRTGVDLSGDPGLAPSLRSPAGARQLSGLQRQLPRGAPLSIVNRRWTVEVDSGRPRGWLVQSYAYPDIKLLVATHLIGDSKGVWRVEGLLVMGDYEMSDSSISVGDIGRSRTKLEGS